MQTIYLDISNKGVVPTVYAKQNDVGRKFAVILTDSGLPYIPEIGSVFSVWYKGANGEGNYTDIGEKSAFSLNGNKVEVEMIVQMLSTHGDGILCLTLNSPDGNQISSWNIPYMCEIVPGSESEKAEEYYTAFSESVEKLKQVTENLTPEAIGAAPAGYGLGLESGLYLDDCDKGTAFGLFMVGWQTANNPLNTYGALLVLPHNNTEKTQILTSSYTKTILIRHEEGGEWKHWEWVNPPMIPGVEYRTTERWNSKVVYTKLAHLGTTAAQFRATLAFDRITNLVRCVPNLSAVICNDWDSFTFNTAGNSTTNDNAFYFLATKNGTTEIIVLATCGSLRTGLGFHAQFWYTKD